MKTRTREATKSLAAGLAAGVAGTALVQGMMAGTRKIAPEMLPPVKEDPGHFMVKQAERLLPQRVQQQVPEPLETAAAWVLAFGYGMTFAALYSLARQPRPRRFRRRRETSNLWRDGAVLGAATWAVGYLGWLPATKLAPPVWKQKSRQVYPNIFSHLLFGWVAVALCRWLRRKL